MEISARLFITLLTQIQHDRYFMLFNFFFIKVFFIANYLWSVSWRQKRRTENVDRNPTENLTEKKKSCFQQRGIMEYVCQGFILGWSEMMNIEYLVRNRIKLSLNFSIFRSRVINTVTEKVTVDIDPKLSLNARG